MFGSSTANAKRIRRQPLSINIRAGENEPAKTLLHISWRFPMKKTQPNLYATPDSGVSAGNTDDLATLAGRQYRYERFTTSLLFRDLRFRKGAARPGDPLPAFELITTDGDSLVNHDLLGSKSLLLIFGSRPSAHERVQNGTILRHLTTLAGNCFAQSLLGSAISNKSEVFIASPNGSSSGRLSA